MSIKQSKYSVAKVINGMRQTVCYLSNRDIEKGLDTHLDMQGYTIIAL